MGVKATPGPKSPGPGSGGGNRFEDFYATEMGYEPGDADLPPPPAAPVPDEDLRNRAATLRVDRKGRRGRTVTLVIGLGISPDRLAALAKKLKQSCGSGGAVVGETIEIQGDLRDSVEDFLKKAGVRVRRSG